MSAIHRSAALLAICCLMLTPALAAAAAPNQLDGGSVTPGSGTTQTTFTFTVAYSSEKDFPATSVVALVAGRSVQLQLVSGSAIAGMYLGSATLAAGTWPVTFEAQAAQGPAASVGGPTIAVSAPPSPPTPQPVPAATPAPPPPVPLPNVPVTAAPQSQALQPSAIPSEADLTPGGSPTPTVSPRPDPSGDESESPASAGPSTTGPTESATPGFVGGLSSPATSDGSDSTLQWLTIIGAGAAAVLLLIWWRRRGEGEAIPVADTAPGADPRPISLSAHARARQRQAAQGAHSEDPILQAMGVGAGPVRFPQPDAPLSRRVSSGPGERPPAGGGPKRRAG